MDTKKGGSSGTPNRRPLPTILSPNPNNQTHKLRVYYANVDKSLLGKYDGITLLIANNKCIIFEHAMNPVMSPEEPGRTLKGN